MQTQTVKEQVRQAVEELPDDATFADALERIYELGRLEGALEDSDGEDVADHEEIVTRFSASSISAMMTSTFRRTTERVGSPD